MRPEGQASIVDQESLGNLAHIYNVFLSLFPARTGSRDLSTELTPHRIFLSNDLQTALLYFILLLWEIASPVSIILSDTLLWKYFKIRYAFLAFAAYISRRTINQTMFCTGVWCQSQNTDELAATQSAESSTSCSAHTVANLKNPGKQEASWCAAWIADLSLIQTFWLELLMERNLQWELQINLNLPLNIALLIYIVSRKRGGIQQEGESSFDTQNVGWEQLSIIN